MNLPSSELERVLRKSAEEISTYDNDLANFVMDRIDESLTRTNAYAYEVMEGTAKKILSLLKESWTRVDPSLSLTLPIYSRSKIVGNMVSRKWFSLA